MGNILIDIRGESEQIQRLFRNQDTITLESLFDKLIEIDDELEYVKEEFDDYKHKEENDYDAEREIPNIHYDNMMSAYRESRR